MRNGIGGEENMERRVELEKTMGGIQFVLGKLFVGYFVDARKKNSAVTMLVLKKKGNNSVGRTKV